MHPVGVPAESRAARAEISAEHDDIYRLDVLCMMQKPFQVLIIPMEVAAEQHADAHLCVSGVGTAAKKASSVMISKPGRGIVTRPRKSASKTERVTARPRTSWTPVALSRLVETFSFVRFFPASPALSVAASKMPQELIVLALNCGMVSAELAAAIDKLKDSSKSIGSHKSRQLYWDAYTKLAAKANTTSDGSYCFLKYSADTSSENPEGEVEVVELTKRQKGMAGLVMGPKFKPPEDPSSKTHVFVWSEAAASRAWQDLMYGEPCVYITPAEIFVGTRHKRASCKTLSSPLKTAKDVEKLVAELKPDAPLRSVSFAGNEPVVVNSYNTLLAGTFKLDAPLPETIGSINTTSCDEIYEYFLARKAEKNLRDADELVSRMLVDVNKNLVPLICAASTKEAAVAYKSALMKRVYVDEKKYGKFAAKVREDGQVELITVTPKDDGSASAFRDHGSLVFEMFYRVDLTTMGA